MATRNPANVIEFGYSVKDVHDPLGYGATVTTFSVTGAAGVDAETAPGEDLERFVEVAAQKGTVIGLGSEAGGEFNLYMENSSWAAGELEAAVQAIGGVFAAATVTDGGL